jgi:thioredoxin reductase (NADPH)
VTPRPAILAVDDHEPVLGAVLRDLRRRYGKDYRILGADSGPAGLQVLEGLALRSSVLALLVVDQRMPGMTGVEFLKEAVQLFPEARRVLLTAFADTDAAIQAINEVRVDHYLLKPWDPPEERLYPVLDELLEDWRAGFEPPFDGVRILGHRWSPEAHRIKDYLTRNLVPFRWVDVEGDPEGARLAELSGTGPRDLPLVLFPDGTTASRPANSELGHRIGLRADPKASFYDLIIVGAGPAGLAAAVYAASEGLSTLIIEKDAPGGRAGMSSRIENYLGFPAGLSGGDLARRALAQAKRFGAEILTPMEAVGLRLAGDYQALDLADGSQVSSLAVLIASGISYGTLDVPGCHRLAGAGVYYGAALTEAWTVRDQDVFIVGGGNSAGQAAVHLASPARSVTILVRRATLAQSMSRYLVTQLEDTPNVRIRTGTTVLEAQGEDHLEALRVLDAPSGQEEVLPASALFIFIGATARTDWLEGVVDRDPKGYLLTGPDVMRQGKRPRGWTERRDPFLLESSSPGIFVAGDVRHRSVKRIASAVGEGAMAVQFVHGHLASRVLALRVPPPLGTPSPAPDSSSAPRAASPQAADSGAPADPVATRPNPMSTPAGARPWPLAAGGG